MSVLHWPSVGAFFRKPVLPRNLLSAKPQEAVCQPLQFSVLWALGGHLLWGWAGSCPFYAYTGFPGPLLSLRCSRLRQQERIQHADAGPIEVDRVPGHHF